ncbi:SusD/RagB family nutrient-binding outer membrane lipoprotein [Niabella beijingensis]|uniref:SusD/RagB family nutrient-binding outer membrane lipoprotein n=1 Tax=Niabella beijingensis TaxID=2872700 RepID=UPI001CBD757B|nr:SusD/RagB family nutrient-binding outer membrane lipoprotein [Niabella beijingensis]MBZ4187328.1 SusD/RagB family nutrient-binding outer membrane lipoprotein [Niabella beijingensis]
MKQSNSFLRVLVPLVLLFMCSCTKDFKDLNTNPIGLTKEQEDADYTLMSALLQQAQRFVIPEDVGTYQLSENLTSDSYSGYMGAEAPFRSNANNLTYSLVDDWNKSIWVSRYTNVMNPTYKVIAAAQQNPSLKDLEALARIIRVSALSRVSDKIGPVIYSHYNLPNDDGTISYDAQKDAYRLFFKDLDTAISILKTMPATVSPQMKNADLAYTADNYTNWLKYANTLKLRLALRIALIDAGMAKTQGESALDPANGGLLSENSQNCSVSLSVSHPLNVIVNDWSDTRMGAPMESIMGGYNDPRMPKYFQTATDPKVTGQYKGIRSGINIDEKSRYDSYSKLVFFPVNKMQLMVAAESWFLRAEAALRGWANAGDAKINYENGIDRSFTMYGLNANAYKSNATSKPKPYIDPKALTPGENDIKAGSPYLSTITIQWNAADNNNRKLERIITQKWIAIFPDGEEAWAEYRRTGYPILFPVIANKSAGVIPTLPGIRSIPIPQVEFTTNKKAAEEAAATMSGPSNGATRLWWDVVDKSFK